MQKIQAPTPAAIAADAAAKPAITPGDFSIIKEPGAGAYPICGYSWVLVFARRPSQPAGRAPVALPGWMTRAGQAYAATGRSVPKAEHCCPVIRANRASSATRTNYPSIKLQCSLTSISSTSCPFPKSFVNNTKSHRLAHSLSLRDV